MPDSGSGLGGRGMVIWSMPCALVTVSLLAFRWGVGLLGSAIATVLAWQTVEIRSTQSATGILYVAFTLILCGELTALILARSVVVPL